MILNAVLFHKNNCYIFHTNKEAANNFNELKFMNNVTYLDFWIKKHKFHKCKALYFYFSVVFIEIDLGCHHVV